MKKNKSIAEQLEELAKIVERAYGKGVSAQKEEELLYLQRVYAMGDDMIVMIKERIEQLKKELEK